MSDVNTEASAELSPRRGSGAWKAKHAVILAAALDEFIERGFNGASMDRIAGTAKVSKVTIYNHFENKDLLFRATIDYYLGEVHPGVPTLPAGLAETPREALCCYGKSVVDVTSSRRSIGMIRLLRADPHAFGAAAPGHTEGRLLPDARGLAGALAKAVAAGCLIIDDCELAARQFLGMLLEATVYPSLLGQITQLSSETVQRVVDSTVAMFLAQYAPRP